jgi:chromatin modification-related protein VID21
MKWMSTDFREERKWKKALAASFAEWCAEYVNGSPEVQASLRVRSYIPKHARQLSGADEDMNDAPTPELIPSGLNEIESESVDDDDLLSSFGANPPAGLFSLGFNDVVMKIDWTPASEAMLQELPSYEPLLEGAPDVTPVSFCDPPILPVSKFITGKLVSKVRGPPRKRSRYEYDSEDEPSSPPSRSGTSAEHSMPSTPGRRLYHRNDLPAEMTDVALFNPENKHVRDRLQAAHQFRPPTEFPMPSVSFFENRQSSQWLWEEDQKLRGLVKEYTFNWSLVAQQLALPSMYVSGSGRRTPWECFERWVQLEGLPAEMSKTQYFRTYQTRLEQAQRTVTAQHQAQQQLLQQQAQQGQAISGQARRRTTQPIRVERRRENRHLAIIDGMRKLARKRESIAHKQAESQKAAQLRKAHEPAPPKSNVHTPQEFSRLKWEREEKMKQKMQMQQELNMRQAMAAAAQRQAGMQGQPGMANGVNPQQRTGTPNNNGNVAPAMANSSSQPGHPPPNPNLAARQHPGQQQQQQAVQTNYPNGNMSGMPLNNTGVPQAQMQATMQNTQRMGPPMAMQRSQFPNTQQHQFQLQQQQINMASNLTANMGMTNGMPNANMMGSMAGQNTNGNMNATMNGSMNGNLNGSMNGMSNNAGSPRLNQVNPQMHNQQSRPLSSGHMPQLLQIQNSLKTSHPEWTSEQVQKMASDQLQRYMAKQRQQAMSAASGSSTGMNSSPQVGNNHYISNGQMQNSPSPNAVQNYQNQLLAQQRMIMQQQRQNAGSPGMNGARPVSRSATPQNPQQLGLQSPSSQPPRTQ